MDEQMRDFVARGQAAQKAVDETVGGKHVALVSSAMLAGTVRNDTPVARLYLKDEMGVELVLDLEPWTAIRLAGDLIEFVKQVGL